MKRPDTAAMHKRLQQHVKGRQQDKLRAARTAANRRYYLRQKLRRAATENPKTESALFELFAAADEETRE